MKKEMEKLQEKVSKTIFKYCLCAFNFEKAGKRLLKLTFDRDMISSEVLKDCFEISNEFKVSMWVSYDKEGKMFIMFREGF